MAREFTTNSAGETRALGARLGAMLGPSDYICLRGELGAGKTTFVQGLAEGLGVADKYVTSPSFALVNEYRGRLTLYHIDLYRLSGAEDLGGMGFDEYPDMGVAAVEWPERAGKSLPDVRLDVSFTYADDDKRIISISAEGGRYEEMLEGLCRSSR